MAKAATVIFDRKRKRVLPDNKRDRLRKLEEGFSNRTPERAYEQDRYTPRAVSTVPRWIGQVVEVSKKSEPV
jgi:hypothetical protein